MTTVGKRAFRPAAFGSRAFLPGAFRGVTVPTPQRVVSLLWASTVLPTQTWAGATPPALTWQSTVIPDQTWGAD